MSRHLIIPIGLILVATACAGRTVTPAGASAPVATTRIVTTTNNNLSVSAINNPTASVKFVASPPSVVWDAVQAAYGELKIPLTAVDPAKMTVRNAGLRVRRTLAGERMPRWLECGGSRSMPNAETYQIDATINTQVVPARDGTGSEIVTLFEAVATPVAFAGAPVACASTMELEKRIYTVVGQKIGF